eukprot:6035720-Amphidinium_carterae.1
MPRWTGNNITYYPRRVATGTAPELRDVVMQLHRACTDMREELLAHRAALEQFLDSRTLCTHTHTHPHISRPTGLRELHFACVDFTIHASWRAGNARWDVGAASEPGSSCRRSTSAGRNRLPASTIQTFTLVLRSLASHLTTTQQHLTPKLNG